MKSDAEPAADIVYVVLRDGGCEGLGEPVRVFKSKLLLDVFLSDRDYVSFKVFERQVEDIPRD